MTSLEVLLSHQGGIAFKDFIYLFLERGEGKEKERETNINMFHLSCAPSWGFVLKHRLVP